MATETAEIFPLTTADAGRCAVIEAVLFDGDSPWPEQAFRSEIEAAHNHYFGLRVDNEFVGYAGISVLGPVGDRECEVHTIAVTPGSQGRGLGRALLDALLSVADHERAVTYLEVRVDNDAAIDLYRRNGFVDVGIRRGYYQQAGVDALTMRRDAVEGNDA
nr:ribosomal protein S18-alanine N-acetyltransferase [Jongsikchunia kroppenstedtii]